MSDYRCDLCSMPRGRHCDAGHSFRSINEVRSKLSARESEIARLSSELAAERAKIERLREALIAQPRR